MGLDSGVDKRNASPMGWVPSRLTSQPSVRSSTPFTHAVMSKDYLAYRAIGPVSARREFNIYNTPNHTTSIAPPLSISP